MCPRSMCPQKKSLGRSIPWTLDNASLEVLVKICYRTHQSGMHYLTHQPRDASSKGHKIQGIQNPRRLSTDTLFRDTTCNPLGLLEHIVDDLSLKHLPEQFVKRPQTFGSYCYYSPKLVLRSNRPELGHCRESLWMSLLRDLLTHIVTCMVPI
jgi:hypothetical protein